MDPPKVYGPKAVPISAAVPDSAATTHRTCGNAPAGPGAGGPRRRTGAAAGRRRIPTNAI